VCKQILIDAKLKTGKRGQKTSDWEKSIKEAGVCNGLVPSKKKYEEKCQGYPTMDNMNHIE
jgi:hypothetical protein